MDSRQGADDEPVGVVDHLSRLGVFDGAVELGGVPVAVVRVRRGDSFIPGAQLGVPTPGRTWDSRCRDVLQDSDEGEHLSRDLEHGDVSFQG